MVGRLRSLPLTFLGAIILGLLQSYAIGYLPWAISGQLRANHPMIYLFVVILVLPNPSFDPSTRSGASTRVASLKESVITSIVFLVAVLIATQFLSQANLNYVDRGVCNIHHHAFDGSADRLRRSGLAVPADLRRTRRVA